MDPTCPAGCDEEELVLPTFLQDECVPEAVFGQISELFLGIPGNVFATGNLTEWTTRLGAVDATRLIRVLVRGDRPRSSAGTPIEISNGRKIVPPRDMSINFTIDDVNPTNHDAIRLIQCGGTFLVWYKTFEGKYYFGGLNGIKGFIDPDLVIPAGTAEMASYQGTITWKAKFTEEMLVYPLA